MDTRTTNVSNSAANNGNVSNSTKLEAQLTDFVQKSLADSYSLKLETALQVLDEAWEAQKLLWQMRDNTRV
jgi:hypothetical protein